MTASWGQQLEIKEIDPWILSQWYNASRTSIYPFPCVDIPLYNRFTTSLNPSHFFHQLTANGYSSGGMPMCHWGQLLTGHSCYFQHVNQTSIKHDQDILTELWKRMTQFIFTVSINDIIQEQLQPAVFQYKDWRSFHKAVSYIFNVYNPSLLVWPVPRSLE